MDSDDYIRSADNSYSEQLIPDIGNEDEELMRIIQLSRDEYYGKSETSQFLPPVPPPKTKKELKRIEKENLKLEKEKEKERLRLEKIELLRKEKEEKELQQRLEVERIEHEKKEKREHKILSLSNFSKKLKMLVHSPNDISTKNYIENILDQYFDSKIESIIINDISLYNKVFDIINSYYQIPLSKNKTTPITEEEDIIIRSIFKGNLGSP
jgi:hypothetical protein